MSKTHSHSESVADKDNRHAFVHVHTETMGGKLRKFWAKRPWGQKIFEPEICWSPVSKPKQCLMYRRFMGLSHSYQHKRTCAKEVSSIPASGAWVLTACNCGVDDDNGFLVHKKLPQDDHKKEDRQPVIFNAAKVELIAHNGRSPMTQELNNWVDTEIFWHGPIKREVNFEFEVGTVSIAKLPSNKKIKSLLRTFPKAEGVHLIIEVRQNKKEITRNRFNKARLQELLLSDKYKRLRVFARVEHQSVPDSTPQADHDAGPRAPSIYLAGVGQYAGLDPENPKNIKMFNLQEAQADSTQDPAMEHASAGEHASTSPVDEK